MSNKYNNNFDTGDMFNHVRWVGLIKRPAGYATPFGIYDRSMGIAKKNEENNKCKNYFIQTDINITQRAHIQEKGMIDKNSNSTMKRDSKK